MEALDLKGRKGLVIGIANEHSLASWAARHFRGAGAGLTLTSYNDKAKLHVAPLAEEVEAPLFLPCNVAAPEAMILVKGGYTPDVVLVQHGRPVRLNFRREETASCSDTVLIPDFNKNAKLPTGQNVPVEFLPEKPGEHEFACPMGMFRGRLVVE